MSTKSVVVMVINQSVPLNDFDNCEICFGNVVL